MKPPCERGSALIPAVGILAALTVLALMSVMAGGADLVLSTRLARSRAAFYAAESALESALAEISGDGAVPDACFRDPWPAPGLPVRRWRDGAWSCERSVALLPDLADADGDPATPVVLFNRAFGYPDSPRQRGGYPVLQVVVSASDGGGARAIAAEVAPVTCSPRLDTAWTAAGALALAGDVRVGGSSPAVVSRAGVALADGAAIEGGTVTEPALALPGDVLGILAPGATLARLDELPEPSPGAPPRGVLWSRGNYSGPLAGEGILVVHNPAFDPVRHEASRRALEDGVFGEDYDPAYSHLDPSRQPARLEMMLGGEFRGVIVADTLGVCAAGFTLSGGLVTLTRSPQDVRGDAPLRVVHDRGAIEAAGRGPLRHLVGFRPLSAVPEPAR
ncbi:MAG TPA: pilus assembly PilX N-terminal domain-containing protein [bacterium]